MAVLEKEFDREPIWVAQWCARVTREQIKINIIYARGIRIYWNWSPLVCMPIKADVAVKSPEIYTSRG